jgi:hypothetical protein
MADGGGCGECETGDDGCVATVHEIDPGLPGPALPLAANGAVSRRVTAQLQISCHSNVMGLSAARSPAVCFKHL